LATVKRCAWWIGAELPETDRDGNDYVDGGIFRLHDFEAAWGQFEDLENLLRLKDIPFDRESGGYYEFIPERIIYRPARNGNEAQNLSFLLLNDEPALSVREIREILDKTDTEEGPEENLRDYLNFHFPAYLPLGDYVKED
jgi:hypothetical protein